MYFSSKQNFKQTKTTSTKKLFVPQELPNLGSLIVISQQYEQIRRVGWTMLRVKASRFECMCLKVFIPVSSLEKDFHAGTLNRRTSTANILKELR